MEKSTHKVEVVQIKEIEKHPNADRLGIVRIENYVCCVGLGEFKPGDLVAYIPPDSVVPDKLEYSFLNPKGPLESRHRRIRAKKLRGVWSMGLLVKAPKGSSAGDNVADILGIEHYEPPIKGARLSGGWRRGHSYARKSPNKPWVPHYDLDTWRKYGSVLVEGEEVIATEKIHGTSSRYTYVPVTYKPPLHRLFLWTKSKLGFVVDDGEGMHCGSHNCWRYKNSGDVWWSMLDLFPQITEFCKANPDYFLFGEIFGDVQEIKYGAKEGEYYFRAFDIATSTGWLDYDEARHTTETFGIQWVPEIYRGPYNAKLMEELSMGQSTLADHIREGIVIRPVNERWDDRIGRVCLKLVSLEYLEKAA